jgi:hypothetical protein
MTVSVQLICPPVSAVGGPVFRSARSAAGPVSITADEVLLLGLGSPVVLVTCAVLVTICSPRDVPTPTCKWIVRVAPLASSPSAHVTVWPAALQPASSLT